jgi:hypothetical protein
MLADRYVSAFMTNSVINGIGWRWGIGIDAIVMPIGLIPIIALLLPWQHKAKKIGFVMKTKMSVSNFCSEIDLGGMGLFTAAFTLILVPVSMAGTAADGWRTSWVIACIVLGGICLIALPFYEKFVATHPFFPFRYLKDRTISMALLLYSLDGIALGVTHTYFYTWLIVARGYSVRDAVFINAANGTSQLVTGILLGIALWYTCRYKWSIVVGVAIRFLGYGLMFRVRNADSSTAELVVAQIIQGVGDSFVSTSAFVAATVAVPHREMAAMTALAVCLSTLGSTIGSAIGGGIYTTYFPLELAKTLGSDGTATLIASVFNSITSGLPDWGTPERDAISIAVGLFTPRRSIADTMTDQLDSTTKSWHI